MAVQVAMLLPALGANLRLRGYTTGEQDAEAA